MNIDLTYQAPALNRGKLKALVHYVCDKAPSPRRLGATRLNKILFYSDRQSYLDYGQPITGETYVKRQFGPVPKHVLWAIENLEREGAIAVREPSSGVGPKTRQFFSLQSPPLDMFSAEEISTVDEYIRIICNKHTAKSISEASHDIVWEVAEIGEEIPYFTVYSHLLGDIDVKDVEWAISEIGGRS